MSPITDAFGTSPHVKRFLDRLAMVFRGAPKPEGLRVIEEMLDARGFSEEDLQDAAVAILEQEDRFPPLSVMLRHIKRRTPQAGAGAANRDREIFDFTVETLRCERLWLEKFERDGNAHMAKVAAGKVASLSAWVDRHSRPDHYHEDDCTKIGSDERGLPNRAYLAGITGDERYLTARGARDTSEYEPVKPAADINPIKDWDF